MWISRLPADFRRRYYVNITVLIALFLLAINLWRFGSHAGDVLLGLVGLLLAFALINPIVRILLAKPRPETAAFVLCGTYVAGFAYFGAAFFTRLPLWYLALLAGCIALWVVIIRYRTIVLPDLFGGNFKQRWNMIRAAQLAEKAELRRSIAERLSPPDLGKQ